MIWPRSWWNPRTLCSSNIRSFSTTMMRRSSSPHPPSERSPELAKARGTGARALRSIMEGIMLDIMFELPDRRPNQKYVLTDKVVRGEESLFTHEAAA